MQNQAAPIVPLKDIAKKAIASYNDPGQFTPRAKEEPLNAWQDRALVIALEQLDLPVKLDAESICSECKDDIGNVRISVDGVFNWIRDNGFSLYCSGLK